MIRRCKESLLRFNRLTLIVCALAASMCIAQELPKNQLRVTSPPSSAGLRNYSPSGWGIVNVEISNRGDVPGETLVTSYFDGEPTLQYGRRIWVPAKSRRSSWYPIFAPGNEPPAEQRYDLKSLQFKEGPRGAAAVRRKDERLLTSTYLSAKHRGFVTGMIEDADAEAGTAQYELAVAMRVAHGLPRDLSTFHDDYLPAIPEALQGMHQLIVCSDRPASDFAGLAAIRHWLLDGGRLWIMLDKVSPETASLLVEEAFDCHVVDRVGLTEIAIRSVKEGVLPSAKRELEEPVEFVRVLTGSAEVTHTVNGWPAAFWQPVGRGKVFYTTLGARGWIRPRAEEDEEIEETRGNSRRRVGERPDNVPSSTFIPIDELVSLGALFLSAPDPLPVTTEQLRPMLTQQIGYKIVSRRTLLALLSVFCVALLASGLLWAKRKKLELIGWSGPAIALCIAATIIVLGSQSRQAVSNTLAEIQIVETSPGSENLNVRGTAAIFNRSSSDAVIGTTREGVFMPDSTGLSGRVRRMVWTDMNQWHFENLAIPAGVRFAPFQVPARYASQVVARASFGPNGLEGRVTTGPFESFSDAVITTEAGQTAAVQFDELSDSGVFSVASADVLPPGAFISSTLLSDEQRRRQAVFRQFVPGPEATPFPSVPTFMAWAPGLNLGFDFPAQDRKIGSALVLAPLVLDRSPPGKSVVIPAPFLPYRMDPSRGASLAYSNNNRQWIARKRGAKTWLRVQFPETVLPLRVDNITISVQIKGPANKLEVAGLIAGEPAILATRDDPVGTFAITVDRLEAMLLDDGGLLLGVFVAGVQNDKSESAEFDGGTNKWKIEYLHIEARGQTLPPQDASTSDNK